MAVQIPTLSGPQVRQRAIGTPQIQVVPESQPLADLAAPLGNAAMRIHQKSQEDADTAALIAAESQLSNWKLNTMFSPEGGVYSTKGQNALDITNKTMPKFDSEADAIGNTLTSERQRERWAQITANQRNGLNSELNRYEFGERQTYYDQTDQASLQSAQAGAVAYYNDPGQVAYYQNKATAVIASQGQRKGLPPEAVALEVQKFNSSTATDVISRMMLDDPTKAAEYFSTAQGYMTPDDQTKVATALRPSLSKQYASDLFTAVRNGKTGAAMYWGAQIQAESGGQQFKDYGYGKRPDGTTKGKGFLGELKRPDGGISTEISVGVEIDGKEVEIPTLVPTLSKEEIDYLLEDGKPTKEIVDKAVAHAKSRMQKGQSPFADPEPLTSSAGATGIAQIMPETGPEAAKLAGLAWDEERFKADPGYNAELGKAYSNMLFKRYNNDPVLALAAYNAGMGNVDKAIAKAGDPRSTGDYSAFINALPKPEETGPYVEKIIAKSQPKKSEEYARLLEIGQSIPDQTTRKYYEADVQDWKNAQDAADVARFDEASSIVAEQGMARVPPQMLVGLPAEEIKKLEEQDRRRREGIEPVTDYKKLEEFQRMPSAKLAALSLERDIRPYLDNTDFNSVKSMFNSALKGDETTQKAVTAENNAVKSVMNLAGVKFGTSADAQSPANMQKRAQFDQAYKQLRAAFVQKNGTDPTPDEAQKIAEQLLVEVRLAKTGWDTLVPAWMVKPEQKSSAYIRPSDIDLDELSPNERQAAFDRLQQDGLPVTDDTMTEAYLQILKARGLEINRK